MRIRAVGMGGTQGRRSGRSEACIGHKRQIAALHSTRCQRSPGPPPLPNIHPSSPLPRAQSSTPPPFSHPLIMGINIHDPLVEIKGTHSRAHSLMH